MVLVTSVFLEVRGNPEFASVDVTQAVRVPTAIDPVKAAACSDAAIALAMINNVVIGDRVLIVGGGDTTCGAAATELARLAGAAYIAITTGSLIHPIKLATQVDDVIGEGRYWVLEPKYLENMFDKIIYCSREDSDPSKINKVLKSNREGGTFDRITIVIIEGAKACLECCNFSRIKSWKSSSTHLLPTPLQKRR